MYWCSIYYSLIEGEKSRGSYGNGVKRMQMEEGVRILLLDN